MTCHVWTVNLCDGRVGAGQLWCSRRGWWGLSLYETIFTAGHDRGVVGGPTSQTVAKIISDWLSNSSAPIQDGSDSVSTVADGLRNGGSRTDAPVLTEHENVLWLDDDNHLQDISTMGDSVSSTDAVQDYMKACWRHCRRLSGDSQGSCSTRDSVKVEVIAHEGTSDMSYGLLSSISACLYYITVRIVPQKPPSHHSDVSSASASSAEEDDLAINGFDQLTHPPTVSSYEPLASTAMPRSGLGLVSLDGQLTALGGNDRAECLSSVQVYDKDTNEWSEATPMNVPRGRFMSTLLDGKIYACGGSDGRRDLDTVERFDGENWQPVVRMPQPKAFAGIATSHQCLYVIGGYSGQQAQKSCQVFIPSTDEWTPIADLHEGRSQVAVCSHRNVIYAIGGTDSWNCSRSVEAYNTQTDIWSYVAPMSHARRGAAAAIFCGKVYVVGGSDGCKPLDSVEIYDPDTNSWTHGPPLLTPRANCGLAVLSGCLYVVGGYGRNEFLNSMELLEGDAGSQWCSYVKSQNYHNHPDDR